MQQGRNDLVFKIAGKMFAVMVLDAPAKYVMSFKCTEEKFNELVELDGIDPAPYMARNKWVALARFDLLSDRELKDLLRNSYRLVHDKLPKKTQAELSQPVQKPPKKSPRRKPPRGFASKGF